MTERKGVEGLLDELEQYADESIGAAYGTLSATFVKDFVEDIRNEYRFEWDAHHGETGL